ncbi:uncharacterized protein K441DRAFT_670005 [Cenococcum geophilum 1.58]|uniref:Uncharacterized protein n=1 Tax=Cenococcum geophilum 1.58 TaxID=794803 RepID=A0ACC8ENU4_9PEZI|nr:hypothetical protein K441DRAFT_670005 [Cenococcum geophilum 1.58]
MEIPTSSQCRTCKSLVKVHDLRQCACGNAQNKPLYCIRQCRFCRASDFSTACTHKDGHATCWDRHLPLEDDPEDPHVPLDPLQKLYVDAVTYMEENQTIQDRLHDQDRVAQWFTIRSDESGKGVPRLNVTDRFRHLCNPGALPNEYSSRQFPGFVSFIGDTGIGKSTLLRAVILMGYLDPSGTQYEMDEARLEEKIDGLRNVLAQNAYGPVSKSGSPDHITDPTSFGVHLYRDIAVPNGKEADGIPLPRDTPILFADCEGFRAGQALTNAQRGGSRVPSPNLIMDSPITAKSYGKDGKDGVDLFYARFLYTVSDVVVIIMSGDNQLFPDMQRLVEWAASAVYRSVNHLAQKTLIIVRNMAVLDHKDLYEAKKLKENLLKHLPPLWRGSPLLERFRNDFNSKQNTYDKKIHDNDDLLHKFFSKVRACNIPDTRTATLHKTFEQYQDLRQQIVDASERSQLLRSKNWMQYNIPMLSHILNHAFEHFRTSDEPFDFYKAARNDNPNPVSVSDHISNFIRHLYLLPSFPSEMISKVIAVCLVTWTLRNFGLAREPDEIFNRELKVWCQEGIKKHKEKDQRCGFILERGGPCINKRPTHEYEHCDEKGNRASGSFDDSQELSSDTVSLIHGLFINEYWKLCTDIDGVFALPKPEQARQMRESSMQEYKQYWRNVQSNKTCLGCLQAVPDHILECGHGYCARCVQEIGKPSEWYEYGWVVNSCILCQSNWQDGRHLFRLHPICAGVRALTLDGGGIRGIVEISLLEKVHAAIELDMPLRECFDLIVGTSTGGIIALGLATLPASQSIQALKEEFLKLATKTFEKRRGQIAKLDYFKLTSAIFLVLRIWDSVYRTTPLKEGLIRLFGPDKKLFSHAHREVRVAVTSAKDNGADKCLITNYNRPAYGDQDLDFEREDEDQKEMMIWEAALATASAPFYFRKFKKLETKKNYTDGALHANFPVQYALEEIYRVWKVPGEEKPPLDMLLSVGTGLQKKEIVIPVPLRIGGFEAVCTSFHNNLDSHRQWLEFKRVHLDGTQLGSKVYRLNSRIEGSYVALDHYKSMRHIDQDIKTQVLNSAFAARIDHLARLLIANLFFFEPSPAYRDSNSLSSRQNDRILGTIRCRLARESSPLRNLVDIIDNFWYREIHTEMDLIEDRGWTRIALPDHQRNRVRTQREWLRVECTIVPVEPLMTRQVIAVTLKRPGGENRVPISGFPVEWRLLQHRAKRR